MALVIASPSPAAAQAGVVPEEVRAVVEGTWELVEWHVGDRVLRPPEMEGRWMVHDGLVMATQHRDGQDGFESTAGYGTYTWGANLDLRVGPVSGPAWTERRRRPAASDRHSATRLRDHARGRPSDSRRR